MLRAAQPNSNRCQTCQLFELLGEVWKPRHEPHICFHCFASELEEFVSPLTWLFAGANRVFADSSGDEVTANERAARLERMARSGDYNT